MSGWLLLYCQSCDRRFRKRWEDRFKLLRCPHCGREQRFELRPDKVERV